MPGGSLFDMIFLIHTFVHCFAASKGYEIASNYPIGGGNREFFPPLTFIRYNFLFGVMRKTDYLCNCKVEQRPVRWTHNPKVGGSNPSLATKQPEERDRL